MGRSKRAKERSSVLILFGHGFKTNVLVSQSSQSMFLTPKCCLVIYFE